MNYKDAWNYINSTFYQGQLIGYNTQRIIYHAKWYYEEYHLGAAFATIEILFVNDLTISLRR